MNMFTFEIVFTQTLSAMEYFQKTSAYCKKEIHDTKVYKNLKILLILKINEHNNIV